jgi:dipeptidyl aminopeptidase/acylaminoacyl peptidase
MGGLACAFAIAGCGPTREIAWSPDGRQIAYAPDGTLRLHDVATRRDRVIKLKVGVSNPLWSPDGKCIAACTAPKGADGNRSLSVIDPASGRVRTLVRNVWVVPKEKPAPKRSRGKAREQISDGAPDWYLFVALFGVPLGWRPDGAQLAYVSVALSGSTVTIMDYPSLAAKPIARIAGAVIGLAWSPDGSRIAYVTFSEPGPRAKHDARATMKVAPTTGGAPEVESPESLWLYDIASRKSEKVCEVPRPGLSASTSLQWSPDSQRIGFITGDSGVQIGTACVVEAHSGAKPERHEGITAAAAWSPDLGGVAFVEQREHDGEEVVLLFRGVHPISRRVIGAFRVPTHEVSSNPKQAEGEDSLASDYSLPEFSPDGRRVALRVGDLPDTARIATFDMVPLSD